MDITPLLLKGRQIIQSYGDGGFRISGTRHEGSILLFPSEVLAWPVVAAPELSLESLAAVSQAEDAVEILLIGIGPKIVAVAPELRRYFRDKGTALEVMDTGAACRTYNVLLAEDRRVAAALIAVG